MLTLNVQNSEGELTKIRVATDCYCDKTDQYYTLLAVGDKEVWLTQDQSDDLASHLESGYLTW